jgi:hypothetical protein
MPVQDIREALDPFIPIGLDEIETVSFMNRSDLKYVLSVGRISELLGHLKGFYKILEINGERLLSYRTTYLDTDDYLFFNQHITGKLERNKIRYRNYESTDTTFLEVKRTTNKNRTIKWRIENKLTSDNFCNNVAKEFIKKHMPQSPLILKPVLINSFKRATLVGVDMKERVTIDFDLSFSEPGGKTFEFPFLTIIELKREAVSKRSPIAHTLKEGSVRPTGFSKYCIGTSILYDLPRTNILKPKFLLIKKIENEYCTHIRA